MVRGWSFMKRKIAAIFAADIAGYSRLVAEDEEETLRRLASYRAVTDDFIAKAGGRIFNTAGDAVLAEFPSAVEAVRCAIDIQESLRTRNMAYPPSRQMAFRIGITIGDVVERDGDLLGDGVNIAARLEGLAEVGGICISRAVHEQVANKLSVQFADIGAQEVKNIPTPVHAYMVAMRREDGSYSTPQLKKPAAKSAAGAPNWLWPVVVGVVSIVAICVAGFLYFTKLELTPATKQAASSEKTTAPSPSPSLAPSPSPAPTQSAQSAPPSAGAPRPSANDTFVAETVPFIGDRARSVLANEYMPAAETKAFALTTTGVSAFVVEQPNEEAARTAALEQCQKRADNFQAQRRCEVYAVGNHVVYPHGRPPMPPLPWVRHDPATERPFEAKDIPMTREQGKTRIEGLYPQARKTKSLTIGPGGQFFFNVGLDSVEESVRRSLENCGATLGVACMTIAVDDVFVVPIPMLMKATGFFRAASNSTIIASERDDVAQKLAGSSSGWAAVAVGTAGRPGVAVKASSEQNAISDALANCAKRDSDCHVIAIGPFVIGPNN
jgi:class 3 adenylate cyclase